MPTKKHTPEEIIGKLREAEIVIGQDGTTLDACMALMVARKLRHQHVLAALTDPVRQWQRIYRQCRAAMAR